MKPNYWKNYFHISTIEAWGSKHMSVRCVIISSGIGLLPVQCQAITETNADPLEILPKWTLFKWLFKGPIDKPALVQVMAWQWTSNKPLPESTRMCCQ